MSRKFQGGSSSEPKPILWIGIESSLRIDTDERVAACHETFKNYAIQYISSLPALDAMRAALPTMKQPQIQRSRV
jgi:hypothetical protein